MNSEELEREIDSLKAEVERWTGAFDRLYSEYSKFLTERDRALARAEKLEKALKELSSERLDCDELHIGLCCIREAGIQEIADEALAKDDQEAGG